MFPLSSDLSFTSAFLCYVKPGILAEFSDLDSLDLFNNFLLSWEILVLGNRIHLIEVRDPYYLFFFFQFFLPF